MAQLAINILFRASDSSAFAKAAAWRATSRLRCATARQALGMTASKSAVDF